MNKIVYKVILVKQSKEKVEHFNEMKKKNSFLSSFPAVYWKEDKAEIYKIFRRNKIKVNKNINRIGPLAIWASNIKLLTDFLSNPKYKGKRYLVVFEDDVFPHKKFRKFLNLTMIRNGLLKRKGAMLLSKLGHANFIGVAYDRPHIRRILNYLKRVGIEKPIDLQLLNSKLVKKSNLPFVSLNRKVPSERHKSLRNNN